MNTRLRTALRRSILLPILFSLALPVVWLTHGQDKPKEDELGLRMRLSEGPPPAEKPATPAAQPAAESLSARTTQSVLARLAAVCSRLRSSPPR